LFTMCNVTGNCDDDGDGGDANGSSPKLYI
jgi:hypothetical protein